MYSGWSIEIVLSRLTSVFSVFPVESNIYQDDALKIRKIIRPYFVNFY